MSENYNIDDKVVQAGEILKNIIRPVYEVIKTQFKDGVYIISYINGDMAEKTASVFSDGEDIIVKDMPEDYLSLDKRINIIPLMEKAGSFETSERMSFWRLHSFNTE